MNVVAHDFIFSLKDSECRNIFWIKRTSHYPYSSILIKWTKKTTQKIQQQQQDPQQQQQQQQDPAGKQRLRPHIYDNINARDKMLHEKTKHSQK